MTPPVPLTWQAQRIAYRAQQLALLFSALAFERTARRAARVPQPPMSQHILAELRGRYRALLDRDLANVEEGLYPGELLFQIPYSDYVRALPRLVRDLPRMARRKARRDWRDLPDSADLDRYPPYYRRTFHWQTDGYLSEHSAALYDLGVELLFLGAADIMRRQIIPPVTRFLADRDPAEVRLLDIGCGTGRTLKQLAVAHPAVRYFGVDLSPYYIREARRLLADVPEVSLFCDNAERLPFIAEYFDVVTSVYLFHELPRNARRRVVDQAWRVLRPGGLLVVEDSIQPADSSVLLTLLRSFPRQFHEPFYNDYLSDDLAELVAERGFDVRVCAPHFVAKVVVAQKPGHAGS